MAEMPRVCWAEAARIAADRMAEAHEPGKRSRLVSKSACASMASEGPSAFFMC